MKKFLIGLLTMAALVSAVTYAASVQHDVTDDKKFLLDNRMGGVAHTTQLGTLLQGAHRVAKVIIDVAANDSAGSSQSLVAAHGLGVSLPKNAIITRSYLQIYEQFVDSGAGTVAVHCEDANNIVTAQDLTSFVADAFKEGQSTGASTLFKMINDDACEITATIGGTSPSAGKAAVFIEYVTGL